jgi:hypothetical protein
MVKEPSKSWVWDKAEVNEKRDRRLTPSRHPAILKKYFMVKV